MHSFSETDKITYEGESQDGDRALIVLDVADRYLSRHDVPLHLLQRGGSR